VASTRRSWTGYSNYNASNDHPKKTEPRPAIRRFYTYGKTLTDITGVALSARRWSLQQSIRPKKRLGPADLTPGTDCSELPVESAEFNNTRHRREDIERWGASAWSLSSRPRFDVYRSVGRHIYGLAGAFGTFGATLCPGMTAANILTPGPCNELNNFFT